MPTAPSDEDLALGPMITLRLLMASVRRKRRVWLATGLLGLIIGASLHWVIPAKYTAVTDLYLQPPAGSNATEAMANNVSLLETEAVARQAISAGELHTTPHSLLAHYTGLAVSDNILSISFSGPSQTAAVSGARAVAKAYLVVAARELGLQTNSLVAGLQSQVSSLNTKITNLNTQIDSLSGASSNTQAASQLAGFVNERAADQSQVTQWQAQILQETLNEQQADGANHVLDPAAIAPVSLKKTVFVDGLSGLILGLAVGLAAVILRALVFQQVPYRAAVVSTFAVPVELSLKEYRGPRLMRRRRLSRQLREPTAGLQMIARRLRARLESAPGSALTVVAVGAAEPAALAVGALAFALSSERHRVVVVDAAETRPLAAILGLRAKADIMETFEIPTPNGPPVRVLVAPEDPIQMAQKPPPDDADVLVVLATLDAAFGAEHLTPWATDAVMILSPRGIPFTRMDVSRNMLREAGISLRSIILLGSDPQDESSGDRKPPIDLRLTVASEELST